MEEKRIVIYGINAENREKRAFDLVLNNGEKYIETVNRAGQKLKTPIEYALAALDELQKK